jgi:hypothetical protein
VSIRITHIRKPNPQSPHEAISHYGCPKNDGTLGVYERESFIKWLEDNKEKAYVSDGANTAWCGIRDNGHIKYLQTYADKTWTDNLLSLEQC